MSSTTKPLSGADLTVRPVDVRLWPGRILTLVLAVALLMAAAGCHQPQTHGGSGGTAGGGTALVVPPAEVCDAIRSIPVPVNTKTAAVVVDRTASGSPTGTPPGVIASMTAAQKAGLSLTLIGVNGGGAQPRTLRTIALDPMPGVASIEATEARQAALGCLARWIQNPDLASTADGSDVLGALSRAADQDPQQVVVISDGVANTGALNLVRLGWDAQPERAAASLKQGHELPHLHGVSVVWTDLGQAAVPLSQSVRDNLSALWTAVIKASGGQLKISRPTVPVEPGIDPTISTRTDPMPPTTVTAPPTITCVRVPSGLLFTPDSARIEDPSVLEPVVVALRSHPRWQVLVAGHTADYGTGSAQRRFSRQRAAAVAQALRAAGLPRSNRVATVGYGASRPAQREWRNGRRDEAAAAANRRVEIAYGPDMPKGTANCR